MPAERKSRRRAERNVVTCVGGREALRERLSHLTKAPEELESTGDSKQQLASVRPGNESRHGERAVGETECRLVEVALLQVRQRRVEVAQRSRALRALEEVLGEVHAQRAVEVLRLLRRRAGPRLDRVGDRRVVLRAQRISEQRSRRAASCTWWWSNTNASPAERTSRCARSIRGEALEDGMPPNARDVADEDAGRTRTRGTTRRRAGRGPRRRGRRRAPRRGPGPTTGSGCRGGSASSPTCRPASA